MSTKTSIKRIALVAVSALGFGLVSTVPARATDELRASSVTVGTVGAVRVGTNLAVSVTFGLPTTYDAVTDTLTIGAKVISAPAGSRFNTVSTVATATPVINGANEAGAIGAGNLVAAKIGWTSTGNLLTAADGAAGAADDTNILASGTDFNTAAGYLIDTAAYSATNTTTSARVNITPDVAGTYTVLVHSSNRVLTAGTASGIYQADQGDVGTTFTFTTGSSPASISMSVVGKVVNDGAALGSALIAISFKDADGKATVLGLNEQINLTKTTNSAITLTPSSLGNATANTAGVYYVQAADGGTIATGSDIVTATGSGTLSATLTQNVSVPTVATAAPLGGGDVAFDLKSTTGYDGATSPYNSAGSSHTFTATFAAAPSATATTNYPVRVAVTGGLTYTTNVSVAATKLTGDLTVSQALNLTTSAIVVTAGDAITINYVAPAATTSAIQGATSILSAAKGTNSFTIEVDDQYGNPVQYVAVSASVSGRNSVASRSIGVTDANGLATFSYTDAGTTGTADTVTLTAGSLAAKTATVTYGTLAVSTITVSGGSKAETVAGSTLTAISAADDGPNGSAVAIKAVVKDANGNLLAGVPVTFAVDKGLVKRTAAINYATVYTNSSGEATSYIFDWVAGKQTVTATAGGVSGTDYLTWAASDATSARTLTGTVAGDIVSYKVVDRFGNPVNGVAISLSRTGTGLFGNGASTQTITTDKTGTADASFNGTATVVAELATSTQAYDKAGEIAATAVTAAVAGTTTGTGAALAPAGVGKVSLSVTAGSDAASQAANAAADAAAEAIDAANAATDAANLAAEAADAATVAAEEARDAADAATAAVEELATQVATLMAALKAQITTLANTVAKIAKKVKA